MMEPRQSNTVPNTLKVSALTPNGFEGVDIDVNLLTPALDKAAKLESATGTPKNSRLRTGPSFRPVI